MSVLKVYAGGQWYSISPSAGGKGPPGAQGPPGDDLPGPQGEDGDTGDAGASIPGVKGAQGAPGGNIPGPAGGQGAQGATSRHTHYLSYNYSAQTTGLDQTGDSTAESDGGKTYFRMADNSSGSNAAWVKARVESLSHYHLYHKPDMPTGGVSYA